MWINLHFSKLNILEFWNSLFLSNFHSFRVCFFNGDVFHLVCSFFFILRRSVFSHLFLQFSFSSFSLCWSNYFFRYSKLLFLGLYLRFHCVDLLKLIIDIGFFNIWIRRWTIFSLIFSWFTILIKLISDSRLSFISFVFN